MNRKPHQKMLRFSRRKFSLVFFSLKKILCFLFNQFQQNVSQPNQLLFFWFPKSSFSYIPPLYYQNHPKIILVQYKVYIIAYLCMHDWMKKVLLFSISCRFWSVTYNVFVWVCVSKIVSVKESVIPKQNMFLQYLC